MEILILICLLIVIALLLQDKVKFKRQPTLIKSNPDLPDIMGKPKPTNSQLIPIMANQSQPNPHELNPQDFDLDIDEDEEDLVDSHKIENEEEDLSEYGLVDMNEGFATGVTFEELQTFGSILQQKVLETGQQKRAIEIVQKVQGTELFALLETSIEGAAERIAKLLDESLFNNLRSPSAFPKISDDANFDIAAFV